MTLKLILALLKRLKRPIITLMGSAGLTEKKMADKRFYKTEKAIFVTYYHYYKTQYHCSAKTLAHRANISRSTLYRHHPIPKNILSDYESYLLKSYASNMKHVLSRESTSLKMLFLRSLAFISAHEKLFQLLFKHEQKTIIIKIMNKLKVHIIKEWHQNTVKDAMYVVYSNEILGIIEMWARHNFSHQEIDIILNDILLLTNTAPHRLSLVTKGLADQE